MSEKQEVVPWKEQMALDAQRVAKQERPASSFISLKSGVMTYQDEQIKDNILECIVIALCTERTYYDKPYDPDSIFPPRCFAQGLDPTGLIPHDNIVEPINPTCNGCEKAEFGTALQGKGPACKTYRKLMIMTSDHLKKDDIEEAEIAVIRIPPTSVKNWSNYANKIASSVGVPPWAVITKIIVKPHPKKQFEVTFEAVGNIEGDDVLSQIHARIEGAEAGLLTPYTYDTDEEKTEDSDKY